MKKTSGETGAMACYLRELDRIPRMGVEDERECARLAAAGDEAARQRLVRANLRFVVMVARRWAHRGVPVEDLVNEGNIGLIRAAARFDPDRGVKFVTYASFYIRQAVSAAVQEGGGPIRVPRGALKAGTRALREAARQVVSLDVPVAGLEDGEALAACVEDRSAEKPEEALAGASLRDGVGTVLAALPEREAGVLQDRYGLAGRGRATLLEIGQRHGLSKERVRQIERRALRRIRESRDARMLWACAS